MSPDARTQEDGRARSREREREDERHAHLAHAMLSSPPCAVLRNAVRAHRTGGTRRIPRRVGAAAQHRLALACPYPRGLGWGDVRRSGLGVGRASGWPSARASATGPVFPFVLAAASSAAMIAAGGRDQEESHPVRRVHDRRGSGRRHGQP